jgi:hypothetical protein
MKRCKETIKRFAITTFFEERRNGKDGYLVRKDRFKFDSEESIDNHATEESSGDKDGEMQQKEYLSTFRRHTL